MNAKMRWMEHLGQKYVNSKDIDAWIEVRTTKGDARKTRIVPQDTIIMPKISGQERIPPADDLPDWVIEGGQEQPDQAPEPA